jgi:hypothetical protein
MSTQKPSRSNLKSDQITNQCFSNAGFCFASFPFLEQAKPDQGGKRDLGGISDPFSQAVWLCF